MQFTDQYPLAPFQSVDPAKIDRIIMTYPLAALVLQTESGPQITQIPLIYSEPKSQPHVLVGHMDINNPFAEYLDDERDVYCLFSSPDSYISPSIYPDTQFPGWNYVSAHVTGRISKMTTREELADSLLALAAQNESSDSTYTLTPSQSGFHSLLQYIVGVRIEVKDSKAIIKLSQDKSTSNTVLAEQHLAQRATEDISEFLADMLA